MTTEVCLPRFSEPVKCSDPALGLYLHLPFCLQKCPYCSFFSKPVDQDLMGRYVQALKIQIRSMSAPGWIDHNPVTTLFFGGGTPSVFSAAILTEILHECHSCYMLLDRNVECSIEVNPATTGSDALQELVRAGFNRLSVGAQSFSDNELKRLGRPHSAGDIHEVVMSARRAGFTNINIDLMYGLPGQSADGWQQSLHKALELEPEHLSIYELTIEKGTPFAVLQEQEKLHLPDEYEVLKMMEITAEATGRAGFYRYEISNYARPGRECCHNINYWQNGDYLGLGAAAVSSLAGRRYSAPDDIREFCDLIESDREVWSDVEELDLEARFRETVIMGLRMTDGVSLSDLKQRFGLEPRSYYGQRLSFLEDQGLLIVEGDNLKLTLSGLNLANQVMTKLV